MGKNIIQNNIRKLRFEDNEMTQQQLAYHVHVSRQTIVAIAKGNYSLSLELAFKLSHALKQTKDKTWTEATGFQA